MDSRRALKDGHPYSLVDLLGGDITLVIPDLQRDYSWGEYAYIFAKGIINLFTDGQNTSFGFIYGYEQPTGSNHVLVIDGHQRITTLYLLIGMLYRRVPSDRLRQLLISDYELIDEHQPRLLYQSRREALYFMSDLVTRFFLDRDGRLSQLKQSDWYYPSYNADINITNFIEAIHGIDRALEEASAVGEEWNFERFAEFVYKHLLITYCDLGNRTSAEEMFLTINTTNQPLTLAQKLRSYSLSIESTKHNRYACAEKWNNIEDWFWAHRDNTEIDSALNLWIRLYTQGIKAADFECFFKFCNAYSRLYEIIEAYDMQSLFRIKESQSQYEFAMLPCIQLIIRYGTDASDKDVQRLWHLLTNVLRYQRVSLSGSDTDAALSLVESMPTPDIISILGLSKVPVRIINEEERAKLLFIAENISQRSEIEEIFAWAENHPLLNGKISKLITWTRRDIDKIDTMFSYVSAIYRVWGDDIDKNPNLDRVRRALLTIKNKNYPIIRRGEIMLSLCWHDYDWQRLMQISPGLIRQILDLSFNLSLEDIIDRFSDKAYPFYQIIKRNDLLPHCRKRQLIRPCAAFVGIFDTTKGYTRWLIDQKELKIGTKAWASFRTHGAKCLYTDSLHYDIAIDLYYTPEGKNRFRVEIFNRPDANPEKKIPLNLKPILRSLNIHFSYDRYRNRHYSLFPTSHSAISAISALTSEIEFLL